MDILGLFEFAFVHNWAVNNIVWTPFFCYGPQNGIINAIDSGKHDKLNSWQSLNKEYIN